MTVALRRLHVTLRHLTAFGRSACVCTLRGHGGVFARAVWRRHLIGRIARIVKLFGFGLVERTVSGTVIPFKEGIRDIFNGDIQTMQLAVDGE